MAAPAILSELVERFECNRASYQASGLPLRDAALDLLRRIDIPLLDRHPDTR